MRRFLAVLLLILTSVAHGSEASAKRVCDRAIPQINQLIDFAQTACSPGRNSGGSGYSLIVISAQNALGTAKHRKLYLLVVVAALGKALDEIGVGDVTAITIMDRHIGAQRKYLSLAPQEVVRLSRAVRADKIDLEQMYAGIETSARTLDVPAKKN